MTADLGVYVHWPFCRKKCPYCDFNSHVRRTPIDEAAYINAFIRDITQDAHRIDNRPLTSIFFGGGTPSLIHPRTVEAIIDTLQRQFGFHNTIEITLEANPTSVESQKFADFKTAGVNRVSLGVQSLNDTDLKMLGREHSAAEALRAVHIAQRHFCRWSFDMIYTRPNQTVSAWQQELKTAVTHIGGHVSLYQLTIEQGTDFHRQYTRGDLVLPADDIGAEMYTTTTAYLQSLGYQAYEVSNYALPGDESRHNLIYWTYGDYMGIGAGAHGRLTALNGKKYATVRHRLPEKWIKDGVYATNTSLDAHTQAAEAVLMGLRLQQGIHIETIERILGDSIYTIFDTHRLQVCVQQGLLHIDSHIKTTQQGRLTLDTLLGYIFKAKKT